MQEINVFVVDRGRKYLYLRYTDPVTGQRVEKSARTAKKKEAMKRAGEWQTELRNGLVSQSHSIKWCVFRERYEDHVEATLAESTHAKVSGTFNLVEDLMKPDTVNRITAQWIISFQSKLLKSRQQSTVESHCRHLKASLNWAHRQGLIAKVPHFNKLKKARSAKAMKGRALTHDEYTRILTAAAELPERQRESVVFLLKSLWLSGLRLGEAMSLTWDQWGDGIRVDTTGEHVMLMIPAESEKGGKDRVYPVAPDFGELLASVPVRERNGRVFKLATKTGFTKRTDTASKMIVALGAAAGVQVDEKDGRPVYASAHDFRRAFGQRWARRVMPMVLKELMRHDSVTTTEKYYVGINAAGTADFLASLPREGDT